MTGIDSAVLGMVQSQEPKIEVQQNREFWKANLPIMRGEYLYSAYRHIGDVVNQVILVIGTKGRNGTYLESRWYRKAPMYWKAVEERHFARVSHGEGTQLVITFEESPQIHLLADVYEQGTREYNAFELLLKKI